MSDICHSKLLSWLLKLELCSKFSNFQLPLTLPFDAERKVCGVDEQEKEEEQIGQKMGGVSSDSHEHNDGHVVNQEGTLRQESVMCTGKCLWSRNSPSGKEGIDGYESKQNHLLT